MILSSGGSKSIYDLGDGNVIAVPRVNYEVWKRMVKEEEKACAEFLNIGLLASDQHRCLAVINNEKFLVLKMPNFKDMVKKGIQVRGQSSKDTYGETLLFGSQKNFLNLDYWHSIFQHLKQDIVTMLVNGLFTGMDSNHIAIVNTEVTPQHDVDEPGLITERKQELRLFFFDFSHKASEKQLKQCYYFVDFEGEGGILEKEISEEVNHVAENHLSHALNGITNHEYQLLTGEKNNGGFTDFFGLKATEYDIYHKFLFAFKKEIVESVVKKVAELSENQKKERFSSVPTKSTPICRIM